MYWIFYAPQHALLLKDEHDESEPCVASPDRVAAMTARATECLTAHGCPVDRVTLMTYFVSSELEDADEPADLYLPPHAVIEAARLEIPLDGEDLTTASDAVLSGWHVQSWQSVPPQSVVEWMLQAGPIPRERPVPDREEALEARHQDRLAALAQELRTVLNPSEDLAPYLVLYREQGVDLVFDCRAEDADHAREQALNANPEAEILASIPLPPSGRDSLLQALVLAGDDAAALYLQTADEPA